MIKVGVIGYGTRISRVAEQFAQFEKGVEIVSIADPDRDAVMQRCGNEIRLYLSAEEMLDREELDGVMIGTRCSLHTQMACMVLERNLPLFLEKPVSTNYQDLDRLEAAGLGKENRVVVSFPLRTSEMLQKVKQLIDSGIVGRVEHVQAVNNVPYGGVYYHNWYRDEQETKGLFLQKATHDFDYINFLLGRKPVEICAMKSKQIFKGEKPAGLKCKDCPEYFTCPESPYYLKVHKKEEATGEYCCFAEDTGNEDSGSALIRYEDGMHVSYTQNFFARKQAAKRGARLIGYDGTLEFDWYSGKILVFSHNQNLVETYEFTPDMNGHFGGDRVLVENFIAVMSQEKDSIAPLGTGILSARMCLKATDSCAGHEFLEI